MNNDVETVHWNAETGAGTDFHSIPSQATHIGRGQSASLSGRYDNLHYTGPDGENFYFRPGGHADMDRGVYNLLSDKNLTFEGGYNGRAMTETKLTVSNADGTAADQIVFTAEGTVQYYRGEYVTGINAEGEVETVFSGNNQPVVMTPGQTRTLLDGGNVTVNADGSVTVVTGEGYTVTQSVKNHDHIDMQVNAPTNGVFRDNTAPGGLLGIGFDRNADPMETIDLSRFRANRFTY